MTESKADKELEKLGHIKVKEGPITITYNTTYYPQGGEPEEDTSIEIYKEFKTICLADRVIEFDEIKALYLKIKELEGDKKWIYKR